MSAEPYHGTPEALRDFVAECMNRTAFYAGMAVDYAHMRDDAGLAYSTRCAVAALKQGVSVLKMLEAENRKLREARAFEKAAFERAAFDVADLAQGG